MGRVITMISSVFGVAIVALPAGIITAGYMNEINRRHDSDQNVNAFTVHFPDQWLSGGCSNAGKSDGQPDGQSVIIRGEFLRRSAFL